MNKNGENFICVGIKIIQNIDPFIWFSDSLGLFTWNIFCGKNSAHRGLQGEGATKVGHSTFFCVLFGKTSIADIT